MPNIRQNIKLRKLALPLQNEVLRPREVGAAHPEGSEPASLRRRDSLFDPPPALREPPWPKTSF